METLRKLRDQIITIKQPARAELVIKKSRFIASVASVVHEPQATSFIKQVKQEHSQANHNVYAYLIDEQKQKYSDDGEPGGTAGKPILDTIKNKGLSGLAIVVTRYFGGILLGTGGLVRAYTDAALAVIETAGICEKLLHQELKLTLAYHWLGLIKHEIENSGGRQIKIKYGEQVQLQAYFRPAALEEVMTVLMEKTGAQIILEKGSFAYLNNS